MTTVELVTGFGQEVQRRRALRGMTVEMLADSAGLNSDHLRNLEEGKNEPSLGTVLVLAEALDVAPSELFKALDRQSSADGSIERLVSQPSSKGEEAGRLLERASPKVQEAVLAILREAAPSPRR
jgi:transcriptional regulator with XRE-family HTH domain